MNHFYRLWHDAERKDGIIEELSIEDLYDVM